MKVVLFAASVLFSSAAFGYCYTKNDYASGNSYTVCPGSSGTSIEGSNSRTGSRWQQTQNSDGTYSGYDSRGNRYQGDNNTGYYRNSNGRNCSGRGSARYCYGGN